MSILEQGSRERLAMLETIPVETPQELRDKHPLHESARENIEYSRQEVRDILSGQDKRLLVIIGPCSLDDSVLANGTPAAVAMAARIQAFNQDSFVHNNVKIIMRLPPAKPRTNTGIAGLEQQNLSKAHQLLADVANMGLPLAIEVMHERHFARFGDMLSLAWLGARDISSTLLRHAASAYPDIPLLLKNGEDGGIKVAQEAQKTISEPHLVELTSPDGHVVKVHSHGNPSTGLISRGGASIKTPADFEHHISEAASTDMPLIIDAAHGNAMAHDDNFSKSTIGQLRCLDHIAQLAGNGLNLRGIMIESYLIDGRDDTTPGRSRTDPCLAFEAAADKIIAIIKERSTL